MKHTYAIMRHGQSQANVEGIIVSDPSVGIARYGLTEAGKKQALESARSSDFKARAIYSSDFRRARETAEIVAALQKAPVTETELLRERFFGDYNGTPDTQYQRVWADDSASIEHGRGVESPFSVLGRVLSLVETIESSILAPTPVLLVAHGDVCQILLAHCAGLSPFLHRSIPHMQTAEIRRIRFPENP